MLIHILITFKSFYLEFQNRFSHTSNLDKIKLKIIFFDGYCPMCHAWVKRLIKWDRSGKFRFAPLDSEMGKDLLSPVFPGYLSEETVVYYDDGRIYLRSNAAIRIARDLRFPLNLLAFSGFIPLRFRDFLYNSVARRRHLYGQRYESCPVPPKEWRDRFI